MPTTAGIIGPLRPPTPAPIHSDSRRRVGGPAYALEDLTQTAIDRWSAESETLPEGGDEDDEEL